MFTLKFLSVFVPMLLFCSIVSAQSPCAKIDFNRTMFHEFRECRQRYNPVFAIKDYTANNIPKYRPNSRYFLGTNFNEFSCIESMARFPLNPNSFIDAPVYFKSTPGAFIEIIVYDMDRNLPVYSWRNNDGKGAWSIAHIDIRSQIPNAQIMVQAYMNAQSFVGIEYIHILNKAINSPDCNNMPIAPTKPPTRPTTKPPVKPPVTTPRPGSIAPTKPTPKPMPPTQPPKPNPQANNTNYHQWLVVIIILTSISLALIILTGLYYCFVSSRQRCTHDCTAK